MSKRLSLGISATDMLMRAIDTNILVRLIVRDDAKQAGAYRLLAMR